VSALSSADFLHDVIRRPLIEVGVTIAKMDSSQYTDRVPVADGVGSALEQGGRFAGCNPALVLQPLPVAFQAILPAHMDNLQRIERAAAAGV